MTMLDDLETTLAAAAARPEQFAGTTTANQSRLSENGLVVDALLDAPPPGRLARGLQRIGVHDLTIPLITATPALRRSWFGAIAVASVFGLSIAEGNNSTGSSRIQVFLAIAPLIPLLGVAMTFGIVADPAHETVVAAPVSGFRVFVVRAMTVMVASFGVLLAVSLLLPGGVERIAWILPALAATSTASALSTRLSPRRAAAAVATGWLGLVIIITNTASASTAFGPAVQIGALAVATVGVASLGAGRRRFDILPDRSA